MARRMEELKNRAFRSAPRRFRPRARVPHSRTDGRSVEKRSTKQDRARSWTRFTSPHRRCEQQHQRSSRGGAQGTGDRHSKSSFCYMCGCSNHRCQVCALTGAIQQLAETQQVATAWTAEETRRKSSRGHQRWKHFRGTTF